MRLIPVAIALVASATLTPLARAYMLRREVIDHPNERSSHDTPVVRGLGIAPVTAVFLGALVWVASENDWAATAVATFLFGAIGFVEDLRGIHPYSRLALQTAAAIAVLATLFAAGGVSTLGLVAAPVGAIWIVGYVNAFNFMDGINGISGIHAAAVGMVWIVAGQLAHIEALSTAGGVVGAAAVGFLPFNFPKARGFPGDSGSYGFGGFLAAAALAGLIAGAPPEVVFAPLAIYIADTATTIGIRVASGQTWYLPHREHAYQQLVRSGWSHTRTTLLVGLLTTVCGVLGLASLTHNLALRLAADAVIALTLAAYVTWPRAMASEAA